MLKDTLSPDRSLSGRTFLPFRAIELTQGYVGRSRGNGGPKARVTAVHLRGTGRGLSTMTLSFEPRQVVKGLPPVPSVR